MNLRFAVLPLALVLLSEATVRSEEPVRSTQEELRRRNLYFGDIDGKRSSEYEEAVRRYQRKKGFSASGKEDAETLRSLGLLARSPNEPAPKELEWPEETVLRSDRKIDVAEEAAEIAEFTGVPARVLAPNTPAARRVKRRPSKASTGADIALAAPGQVMRSAAGVAAQIVSQADVLKLLERFLRAASRGNFEDELGLYADRVNYYGNGSLDRRIIEHNLRKYYTQWPTRAFKMSKLTGYRVSPKKGEITVTYQVTFSLKNPKGRVKGTTENRLVLNAATSSPRIVAIQERRLPN